MKKDRENGGNFSKIKSAAIKMSQKLGQKYSGSNDEFDKSQVQKIETDMEKMNRGPIAKVWDKVTELYRLFKSPQTPFARKAAIFGALLYMVLPVDVLPDFIFPAGLLDDVAVIAFIYSQCKDLLQNAVHGISGQIKDAVHDITSDAVIKVAQKQFSQFSARTFINAFLKLSLFAAALTLLLLSPQSLNVGTVTGIVLLMVSTAWLVFTILRNGISFFVTAKKFVPEYKKLVAEKKAQAAKFSRCDIIPQVFYNSLATPELRQNMPRREKIISFLFRYWNEGKLPAWIPDKKELAEIVWNAVKIQVAVFLLAFTGYVIVYNLFVTHLLAENAASEPLWLWLVCPFRYAWWLLTS